MPSFFSALGWVASLAADVQVLGRLEELGTNSCLRQTENEAEDGLAAFFYLLPGTKLFLAAGVAGRDKKSLFYSQKGI